MSNTFRGRINRLEKKNDTGRVRVSLKYLETEEDWEEAREEYIRAKSDPNIIFKDYAGVARRFGL